MIDLDIVFAVLTFGCILFVLQTLVDYNKRASKIRPQLNEVARIKSHHQEEKEKVLLKMEDAEKEASKYNDELAELEAKHGELEIKATELRSKVSTDDDADWRR
jgi:predicted nuclease with TOPRIM domain